MKICLFILNFFLVLSLLPAQTIELEVIAPFGDHLQGSGGMDLHCTLGEPMVERYENGEILTQGFHQVFEMATPVFELPELNIELNVYPNPASDWLVVETDATETLTLILYDTKGRTLYNSKMDSTNETLNISGLAAGTYYLNVSTASDLVQTFIIQKVNQ